MKIGIITIHNVSNYGAVLQSYALKEVIKDKYDVNIINFDNRHVSKSLDLVRITPSLHGLLGTIKDIFRLLPRYRVINKFNNFITEKLDLSEFNDKELSKFTTLISGSDQIWNPGCISSNNTFRDEYFLSFATPKQKKISYASSCGAYKFNNIEEEVLFQYLKDYKSISSREYESSLYLSKITNKEVSFVLDPTLLLNKKQWIDKIKPKKIIKGKYILLYVIKKTNLLKQIVETVKSQLNLKVILVEQGLHFSNIVDKHIRDAGPIDFISLINDAEYIITDSFHGTTFSIIFKKNFISVSPGKNVNRIKSLLNTLNLENRLINEINDLDETIIKTNINYYDSYSILENEIKKSKDYLFSAIEKQE
ncbi:polysaccharide pyruvyl transferase family protein [Proteus mirabilis]|uniref:polysaccharide pyruvyl transferase family protein n=1 Tax=Proteus mirabilis TaxID=584 RepID=UPI0019CF72FB|nr:polysaccharide pyruvyl transferase family protein [Proteus mirabilis]MBI6487225.1 polysaccharide pyruvyl transferase family protein [Proteus mirabilis]MBN7151507.1 polysaccharide pyruvyl transferase family protein [Proteus mirabilis]MBN7155106.1 polysaccharide pyruvyl transferase family protein [Proteus mirabilis]MBN7167787.1 polysaccharide pyruvyl transferase family protein [Proteus mirabilis]MBN7170760.1 polysaccharide pyruvyl transferase family protein [Proteus mirabilis]